jgi:archaeosine-15-forming tRNA-guanine transglycosylase
MTTRATTTRAMTTRKWLRPTLAGAGIAAVAIGALALPAGAAVSVQSQSPSVPLVSLADTATLDAKGAVVFAPVEVTCTPGATAYLEVIITQKAGGKVAKGGVDYSFTCTGAVQQVQATVTANGQVYKQGVAFGQASIDVCDYANCYSAADEHNIQITR